MGDVVAILFCGSLVELPCAEGRRSVAFLYGGCSVRCEETGRVYRSAWRDAYLYQSGRVGQFPQPFEITEGGIYGQREAGERVFARRLCALQQLRHVGNGGYAAELQGGQALRVYARGCA